MRTYVHHVHAHLGRACTKLNAADDDDVTFNEHQRVTAAMSSYAVI